MLKRKKEFVTTLVVIVIVYALMAIPYALMVHTQLISLRRMIGLAVVLAAMGGFGFFLRLCISWWRARYTKAGHDLEVLREENERNEKPRTSHERELNQKRRDK